MAFWSVVGALVLVVALTGGQDDSTGAGRVSQAPPAASPTAGADASASSGSSGTATDGKHLARSRPVRLLIPKISVDAPFTDLAIGRGGQLQPPPPNDTNLVGWYAKGASPGERGTSIIAGHVDTKTAPAVFANLEGLREGDRFQVLRADGRKASFEVSEVQTFDKDYFPSDRVYRDSPRAEVRLITCAGNYDRSAMDYTANLVVFARLV
nr:class F sortase [Streptomyces zinciresistens]